MAVEFFVDGKIANIGLNRPRQRNAMNSEMLLKLEQALDRVESDTDINVAVISGAEPSFCSGSDLTELGSLDLDGICDIERRKAAFLRRIGLCPKPVIASVQGYAMGGGAFLAAVCDIVVATSDAVFQCMEVPNGWITPWGLHALNARMAPRHAQRVAWGCTRTGAEDALRLGLVDYVVPQDDLSDKTAEIASSLASIPPIGIAATKRMYLASTTGQGEASDSKLNALFREHCSLDSAQETLRKFAKK